MKSIINKFINKFGYSIKKEKNQLLNWNLNIGLKEPATIIDVGIGDGTPVLYGAFPKSQLLLIDPLIECENIMKDILKNRVGNYEIVGLGESEGENVIDIYEDLSSSSFNKRINNQKKIVDKRTVSVKTLDNVISKNNMPSPYLLKIDTEGYELEIVRGACETLKKTDAVIAELSVGKRFKNSYRFADFVEEMKKNDLHMVTILDMKSDRNGGIERMDAFFCRDNARNLKF